MANLFDNLEMLVEEAAQSERSQEGKSQRLMMRPSQVTPQLYEMLNTYSFTLRQKKDICNHYDTLHKLDGMDGGSALHTLYYATVSMQSHKDKNDKKLMNSFLELSKDFAYFAERAKKHPLYFVRVQQAAIRGLRENRLPDAHLFIAIIKYASDCQKQ